MNPRRKRFFHFDFSFIAQNLRRLAFEDQIALGANTGTFFACFLPWVSVSPHYAPIKFFNAFTGTTWLLGVFVFCFALFSVLLFVEEVFEKKVLHIKTPRTILLGAMSFQSLLLQLCAWSVLYSLDGVNIEFRFGLALCVVFQVMALVAVWLRSRSSKKEVIKEFFQLPTHEKSGKSEANPHPPTK